MPAKRFITIDLPQPIWEHAKNEPIKTISIDLDRIVSWKDWPEWNDSIYGERQRALSILFDDGTSEPDSILLFDTQAQELSEWLQALFTVAWFDLDGSVTDILNGGNKNE